MNNETPFKGSLLETEIRNMTDITKIKKTHALVRGGKENQPNSIFWKEAFEAINEKLNKKQFKKG